MLKVQIGFNDQILGTVSVDAAGRLIATAHRPQDRGGFRVQVRDLIARYQRGGRTVREAVEMLPRKLQGQMWSRPLYPPSHYPKMPSSTKAALDTLQMLLDQAPPVESYFPEANEQRRA